MLTAYVYADGSDLDEVSGQLIRQFCSFVETWGLPSASVVNDRLPRTAELRENDLPEWHIGLNFEAEFLSPGEFKGLIDFLSETAVKTGREFVIGGHVAPSRFAEDWGYIGEEVDEPTLQALASLFLIPEAPSS